MDALHLPRYLHRLHEFQQGDQWFVADLDTGVVLPTPEPICQILHRCESLTQTEMMTELKGTYSRARLEQAFGFLEALDERGYLFAAVKDALPKPPAKRLHLCVSPSLLSGKPPFLTRWVQYNLLTVLAKAADVSLILPKQKGERDTEISFVSEAIERIMVDEGFMDCILRAVPPDCDGVLLFSPLGSDDLMWYRHVQVPVISYIQSETIACRADVNSFIQHATVMRDGDAIMGDAPWIPALIEGTVAEMPQFFPLFPGTDPLPLSPESDATFVWEKLQEQFPDKALRREALVGIHWGPPLSGRDGVLPSLCFMHPNWTFVTCHPLAKRLIGNRIPNLLCLDLFTYADLMVFATFVSQMDVFLYQGAPGVPILPLLMALGADCPCLVYGEFEGLTREKVFESRLFLLEKEPTVEHLSGSLHQSLAKRQMPRQPISFSWEGTVRKMMQVFHECHSVRQCHRTSHYSRAMKPLFQYHYVKSEDAVEVAAHLLPDFSNVSFETALKLALEGEISPNEIRVVLKRLGSHEPLGHANLTSRIRRSDFQVQNPHPRDEKVPPDRGLDLIGGFHTP